MHQQKIVVLEAKARIAIKSATKNTLLASRFCRIKRCPTRNFTYREVLHLKLRDRLRI